MGEKRSLGGDGAGVQGWCREGTKAERGASHGYCPLVPHGTAALFTGGRHTCLRQGVLLHAETVGTLALNDPASETRFRSDVEVKRLCAWSYVVQWSS